MFCTFQTTPVQCLPGPHADLEYFTPGKFGNVMASLHVVGKLTKQPASPTSGSSRQLPIVSPVPVVLVLMKSLQIQPKKENFWEVRSILVL